MKQFYTILCLSTLLSATTSFSQSVTKIYDHDTTDLSLLLNMPFDETRLLVVSGASYSPSGLSYHELNQTTSQLIDLSFPNINTIFSFPTITGDKLFFEASVNGIGREIVSYDGTTTLTYDLNAGAGDSDPEIIEFDGEVYAIAFDGGTRQLFKYDGVSNFDLISAETNAEVTDFIASRNDSYYYITFNSTDGRKIKVTEDNSGVLSHSIITPTSYQETLSEVVLLNDDIYMLSAIYTLSDVTYRVDKIDINDGITTHHFETAGPYSGGHILAYYNDILYYRTEPGSCDILNVSVPSQPIVQVSIDPVQYSLIGGHVVQNGKLFIYGYQYILDVSSNPPVPIIEDGSQIQIVPAFETNDAFYLYEIALTSGEQSGIIEVSSLTNQHVRYPVSTEAGYMTFGDKVVENNGEITFIFRTNGPPQSTDIYSFGSALSVEENDLSRFEVYPNPSTNGSVNINVLEAGEMILTTVEGQVLGSFELHTGINPIDVSYLSSGVYLVQFGSSIQRLLVD